MVKDSVPPGVVENLLQGQQHQLSASDHHSRHANHNNSLEADVRREINRRIQALSDSGKTFEDGVEYQDNDKDAEDAKLIVQV